MIIFNFSISLETIKVFLHSQLGARINQTNKLLIRQLTTAKDVFLSSNLTLDTGGLGSGENQVAGFRWEPSSGVQAGVKGASHTQVIHEGRAKTVYWITRNVFT